MKYHIHYLGTFLETPMKVEKFDVLLGNADT